MGVASGVGDGVVLAGGTAMTVGFETWGVGEGSSGSGAGSSFLPQAVIKTRISIPEARRENREKAAATFNTSQAGGRTRVRVISAAYHNQGFSAPFFRGCPDFAIFDSNC